MGFLDEYERLRKERQEREARELIDHFGGVDGCLKIIFFPITIPYYLIKNFIAPLLFGVLAIIFGIAFSIVIILHSIFILTPLKIVLFLISFGYWNGFEGRNLIERLGDFWNWLNDIDLSL